MTKFAFLFPGQGSQGVGMLSELAERNSAVAKTFTEAGDMLGRDLWKLVRKGPAEELNRTELTQPALLAAGVAVWRCWQSLDGPRPAALAGHSLGEYTALVCGGALDFADGIRLVAARGRFMQEAVPEGRGSMAAILGLDDEVVEAICREAAEGQVVAPANYNSPGQVVISGDKDAVERACLKCVDAGAKRALPLAVSVPSHCALMESAAQRLTEAMAEIKFRDPELPVVRNVDADVYKASAEIRDALIKQLSRPVRWTDSVRRLAGEGMNSMAECGPGKVLGGLVKRIDRSLKCIALEQPETLKETLEDWKK